MKKLVAILMCAVFMLSLAACGGEVAEDQVITKKEEITEEVTESVTELFCNVEGVKVVPGTEMDTALAAKAVSVYEAPSCAIDGTDNIYTFSGCEITAFKEADNETVYSVYFTEDTQKTSEGLGLGDDAAKVSELYGEIEDGIFEMTVGDVILTVMVEADVVVSIEYIYNM